MTDLDPLRADLAALLPAARDWHKGALCAQTDPELFFPEKGVGINVALRICGQCEVRRQCLEESLANDETYGIWGGTTEHERRMMRRERRRREREQDRRIG